MQSNVKPAAEGARTNVLRIRRRIFALLGIGTVWAGGTVTSCKSTAASTEGLVSAPMLAASEEIASAATADARDAGRDGASARTMTEPRPPPGTSGCTRTVRCEDPLLAAPAWPYPHPFERCDPDPPGDAGGFSANATTEKRRDDPETCCYVSFRDCSRRGRPHVVRGRPLRDERGEPVVAPSRAAGAWAAGWSDLPLRGDGDDDADEWLDAAALEHASVAEFARLSLALLALAAPATLVERTHIAALDEIEHARTCYAEASRRLGRPVGPGPLPVSGLTASVDVRSLARDTLLDGCLGECVSAIVLRQRGLSDMAADEERHAELAWEILEFLLSVEPRAARAGIELALSELDDERSLDELSLAVIRDVVRPSAAGLVARYCT